MNKFAKGLLAFAGAAAISLSSIPSVSAVYRPETTYEGVSDWALLEVTAMDQLGLIPEDLQYADLSTELTRQEMCSIAVATYEKVAGEEVAVPWFLPFTDTNDEDVLKAHQLGIVKGDGNGKFRPDDFLTRAEFFCFVGRYLEASGMELTDESYSDLADYTDAATLPRWAVEPTKLTVGLDVVKGSGVTLNWDRTTSGQEALAMFYRAYNASIGFEPKDAFVNLAGWAESSVLRMDQLGLIPEDVKAGSMEGTISRLDLCRMAMRSYKLICGLTDEDLGEPEDVFNDTDDIDVLNAYALGIINGRAAGIFDPDSPITRQDFMTISANFLEALGYWTEEEVIRDLSKYPDGSSFSGYAKAPAQLMIAIGAVKGDTAGYLNPKKEIVSQEAVTIFYRILNYYDDWCQNPVDPELYLGQQAAAKALTYEGCRYVYGGQSPSGFDCSGFVYYVYKQFGYNLKPGADNQWNILSSSVSRSELLPGDLVFFSDNGYSSGIFHVGMYIGDGDFIHAANSRKGVIISSLSEEWYAQRYLGAKRAI